MTTRGRWLAGTLAAAAVSVAVALPGADLAADRRSGDRFEPPGAGHLLGTDRYGRDLVRRWRLGAPTSLGIAVAAAVGAVTTGALLGLVAAVASPAASACVDRLTEAFLSLPRLYAPIVLAATLGPGGGTTAVVLALTTWMPICRLVRQEIESLRASKWFVASVSIGSGPLRGALRHLPPHLCGPLTAEAASLASQALLAEAALTFLGLGVRPPAASWGTMLSGSLDSLPQSAWAFGLATTSIATAALGFAIVGDALHAITGRETGFPEPC